MPNGSDFWTAAETFKKVLKTKLCLAEHHQTLGPCKGKIISAHTVPRSQLRRIAVDGHVCAAAVTAADLAANEGECTAKKVGVSQFSTFNCFCGRHDKTLFVHLEDDPLVFDQHQLTLLYYRTIASEMYRKLMIHQGLIHLIGVQKRKPPKKAREILTTLQGAASGELLGIQDLGVVFDRRAEDIAARNYDNVSALVVYFKKAPSIMTAGCFLPEYDYKGELSQSLNDRDVQMVSFNILAVNGQAALAMIWSKEHFRIRKLADSFIAQPQMHYTTLAIQTAFEHLETTCWNVGWWNSLKKIERNLLLTRMRSGTAPKPRAPTCLTFAGVIFDEWDYDRHVLLNA